MAGRNIVLLSDGTGNSASKLFRTNVFRLYEALDVHDERKQTACYDNGVGTSSFKPLAILGGVFGFGLKRNVLDLYKFACRAYRTPDDRIFGFGFSRGAFTMRVVAALIASEGLAPYRGDEAKLHRDAVGAYREFRREFSIPGINLVGLARGLRDACVWLKRSILRQDHYAEAKKSFRTDVGIHFLGLWDTVAAYGGPIKEITLAIDYWIWPLSMPERYLSSKVHRACHAVSLDDERDSFHPVLWDERHVLPPGASEPQQIDKDWKPNLPAGQPILEIDNRRLSQVWFCGMHSDVGGGYPQDGLSYVTLDWMMERAAVYGLLIDPQMRTTLAARANAFDMMNDSRGGIGGSYRYKPRKLFDLYAEPTERRTLRSDLDRLSGASEPKAKNAKRLASIRPKIHESVFERLRDDRDGYCPIVLPFHYDVVMRDGSIQHRSQVTETDAQALNRLRMQERAFDLVWYRRVVYFATVLCSFLLALMPLFGGKSLQPGEASPFEAIVLAIRGVEKFAPAFLSHWFDAFADNPGLFLTIVLVIAGLLSLGATLEQSFRDRLRGQWMGMPRTAPKDLPQGQSVAPPSSLLFNVRTSTIYQGAFYALTHYVLPGVVGIAMLLALFAASVWVGFSLLNVAGGVCRPGKVQAGPFETKEVCRALGVSVDAGKTYKVSVAIKQPWVDRTEIPGLTIDPNGIPWSQTSLVQRAALPLVRRWSSNYFQFVVRVGATGVSEWPLTFQQTGERVYEATFTPNKTGETFVYVNDAVIGVTDGVFGSVLNVLLVPQLDCIERALFGRSLFGSCLYENNQGSAEVTITPVQ